MKIFFFFFKNYVLTFAHVNKVYLLLPTVFCPVTHLLTQGAFITSSLGSAGLTRRERGGDLCCLPAPNNVL